MKLKSAEAFCQVVELGGIAPAAEVMHCVPSNITKMIKELEGELSEPLFERHKGRLVITPFGRNYYQDLRPLLKISSELDKKYKKDDFYSTLSIGAIDVAADYWLPPRILSFMQQHSNIQINMSNAHSRVLEEGLINRSFDLILSDGPIINPEVTSTLAFEEKLILIGNPAEVNNSPIPLYSFGKECIYNDIIQNWIRSQPVGEYKLTVMESYKTIIALVENDFGISFIPQRVLQQFNKGLLNGKSESITSDVHVAWHRFNHHKAIKTLLGFLLEE
ncbi:DNA-binding transcriptional LysR family regulator [Ewingella americana]